MKILADRAALQAAWALAGPLCPTRSPKPILSNLKLTADDRGAVLIATDLELGIRVAVPGVKVDRPGAAILPRDRTAAILRSCPDAELAIEVTGDVLAIRGERAGFKMPTEDPGLFPEVPAFPGTRARSIAADALADAIRKTIFATDVESTRYALGGVLLEATEAGDLGLVATDGRRLARLEVPCGGGDAAPLPNSPVLPTKGLKVLARMLGDDAADPDALLAVDARAFFARCGRAELSGRLVEGRFPRYQDVFPPKGAAVARVGAGALLRAIEQAQIATSEESRGVDFDFLPDGPRLALKARAADAGESDIDLPLDAHEGPAVSITFDPRYIADFLRALVPEEAVAVDLIDHKSAAVFRADGGYQYVVMPLTRER